MAQTPASLQLQFGGQSQSAVEFETDLGPYASLAEALAAFPIGPPTKRFPGKKIKIVVANVPTEYWWSGGIADVNLIAISTGGGGGGLTSFNGRTAAAAVFTFADLPAGLIGKEIGNIISDDFNRASLGTSYTNIGSATAAITSNKLALSGGDGTYANYVLYNAWYTQLKEYSLDFDIVIDSSGAGLSAIFKGATYSVYYKIDQTGKIYIDYDFTTLTNQINSGSNTISFVAGDVIKCKILRSHNSITFSAYNYTSSGQQIAITAVCNISGSGFMFGGAAQRLAFSNLGGNNTIDNFIYSTTILEGAEIVVEGDSLTDGFNASDSGKDYVGQLSYKTKKRVEKHSTFGNKISDIVLMLPELLLFKPKTVLICIGANDGFNSTTLSSFQASANTIIQTLKNSGIAIIFTTTPPNGSSTITTLTNTYNTWLTNTVGAIYGIQVIDITTLLQQGGSSLSPNFTSDGVHWFPNGHSLVSDLIVNAIKYKFQISQGNIREDGAGNLLIGTTNNTTPVRHTATSDKRLFLGDYNSVYAFPVSGQEGLINSSNLSTIGGASVCSDITKPAWWSYMSGITDVYRIFRAPATSGSATSSALFEMVGVPATGKAYFGINGPSTTGYTLDVYTPIAGNTTLRLNSAVTPQYGFAEFSINGSSVASIFPNGEWAGNVSNSSTSRRGCILLGGFNTFGGGQTNTIIQVNGVAPTGTPVASAYGVYSSNRNSVAGKAGMTILTEDSTSHILSDRVGLGTLTPNAYVTIKPGDHNTPALSFSLQKIINLAGNGSVVTALFNAQPQAPYIIGQIVTLTGNLPLGFNGDFVVASTFTNGVGLTSTFNATATQLGFIGALTQSIVNGAVETNGLDLFFTSQGVRRKLTNQAIKGTFTATGTATSTFTVAIPTQANNTYVVTPVAQNAVSAASFYVTNQTTTTYDIVTLTALTGAVAFGWTLVP